MTSRRSLLPRDDGVENPQSFLPGRRLRGPDGVLLWAVMFSFYEVLGQIPMSPGGFGGISIWYWVIIGASFLASLAVSGMLKRRFAQYSEITIPLTGAQVAEKMLRDNGIRDVSVVSVPGRLTDHYDPTSKTVNLSEPVYHMNNVAAAAVAAHECGHAVQHQQAYAWLEFRSKMVPAVQLSSQLLNALLLVSVFAASLFRSPTMLWIWVALFAVTTLFAFITLPVEFDASRRAMVWMQRAGIASSIENERAKNALFWAAMTYVVAALGSLAQLLYYVSLLLGGRRDE